MDLSRSTFTTLTTSLHIYLAKSGCRLTMISGGAVWDVFVAIDVVFGAGGGRSSFPPSSAERKSDS